MSVIIPIEATPTVRQAVDELQPVLKRMTDMLLQAPQFVSIGPADAQLRRVVGDLLAELELSIRNGTFTEELLNVFTTAKDVGVGLFWLDRMIRSLFEEQDHTLFVTITIQVCIIFALAQEAQIVSKIKFTNRDDVMSMMTRMRSIFEAAKDVAADDMDSVCYSSLVQLAAALTHHLAKTALTLPQVVHYELPPMPALTLAQRIYSDGSRWEELIHENRTVHPLFMGTSIRALSA